jgi:hypothetical protein
MCLQEGDSMDYDLNKVDEMTLALLYLVTSERPQGPGGRAWKGFDAQTITRLHKKGWIEEPKLKSMTLLVTEEGLRKSRQLFTEYFQQTEK